MFEGSIEVSASLEALRKRLREGDGGGALDPLFRRDPAEFAASAIAAQGPRESNVNRPTPSLGHRIAAMLATTTRTATTCESMSSPRDDEGASPPVAGARSAPQLLTDAESRSIITTEAVVVVRNSGANNDHAVAEVDEGKAATAAESAVPVVSDLAVPGLPSSEVLAPDAHGKIEAEIDHHRSSMLPLENSATTAALPAPVMHPWFQPVSVLQPAAFLQGAYGDIVLEMRLNGHCISSNPDLFDHCVQKIQRGVLDPTHVLLSLEVFVWTMGAECSYEVKRLDPALDFVEPLVLVSHIMQSGALRKVLVNVATWFRFLCCFHGPFTVRPPQNVVDVAMALELLGCLDHSNPNQSTTAASKSSDYARLCAMVHEGDDMIWEDRIDTQIRAAGGRDVRRLADIERRFRVVQHGYHSLPQGLSLGLLFAPCFRSSNGTVAVARDGDVPPAASESEEFSSLRPASSSPAGAVVAAARCSVLDLDIMQEFVAAEMGICGIPLRDGFADAAVANWRQLLQHLVVMTKITLDATVAANTTSSESRLSSTHELPLERMTPQEFLHLLCQRDEPNASALAKLRALSVSGAAAAQSGEAAAARNYLVMREVRLCLDQSETFVSRYARHRTLFSSTTTTTATGAPEAAESPDGGVLGADSNRSGGDEAAASHSICVFPTWDHKRYSTGRVFSSHPNVQTLAKVMLDREALAAVGVECAPPKEVVGKGDDEGSSGATRTPLVCICTSLRQFLGAPPRCVLVRLDYCQLELRLLAHLAKEPVLIGILQSVPSPALDGTERVGATGDVFLRIAAMLRLISADAISVPAPQASSDTEGMQSLNANDASDPTKTPEVKKTLRDVVKTIVYAAVYGMSTEGMTSLILSNPEYVRILSDVDSSSSSSVTTSNVQSIILRFHDAFPRVRQYQHEVGMQARELERVSGVARTRVFRRSGGGGGGGDAAGGGSARFFGSAEERKRFDREALSVAVQGSASDVVKIALHAIRSGIPDALPTGAAALLYSAHDELVFAVDSREPVLVKKAAAWLRGAMEGVASSVSLSVPLPVRLEITDHL